MRKLLITLLVAGAAASPALAAPDTPAERRAAREEAREERQQAREQRQQASPRVHSERASQAQRVDAQPSFDRSRRLQPVVQGNSTDSVRDWRFEQRREARQDRVDGGTLRQSSRPLPNAMRTRTPIVSPVAREGTQPPPRTQTRSATPSWSTNWRHNSKYDWSNWRKRHRSLFHLGFYYDPFGWAYRPYSIGWRLWPSYYSSSYWINDPGLYRLPYAPPGYRWIRYWDDAVLVDTWSGQVVDVIHNFFW